MEEVIQAVFPVIAVQLLLSVALAALSYVLAPKPDVEGARPASLGDFKVNTATEGRPVPIIWGTVAHKGPNVVWYGNFRKAPFEEDGVVVGFHYRLGFQFALCHGVIDGITKIRYGEKYIIFDNAGVPTTADISVNKRNLYGGDNTGGQGGFVGRWKIYDGAQVARDAYLDAKLGASRNSIYKGIAYLVLKEIRDNSNKFGAYIGNSSSLSQYEFTVRRCPDNLSLNMDHHIVNGVDANPAEVLYEILTNTDWGLGFPGADVDTANLAGAGETLYTEGNGFSFIVDQVKKPQEVIAEIERQINGRVYLDLLTGQWKIKLVRNDYDIDTVPLLNESSVLRLEQFARGEWGQTFNEVRVPFNDAAEDFKDTYALAQDGANFEIQGRRRVSQVKFPGCTNRSLAKQLAWRELRQLAFPMASATAVVKREFYDVIPGDVLAFSWDEYGIVKLPMRVVNVDFGSLIKGEIVLTLVQDVFQNEAGAFADAPPSEFVTPIEEAVPFATDDQFAIQVPYHVALTKPGGSDLDQNILVGGHSSGGSPTSYEMRYAVPTTYISAGSLTNGTAVVGFLRGALVGFTSSMPAQGAGTIDLDTDDELLFEFADMIGASYTTSEINGQLLGLAVIEPGTANEEWIIYDATASIVDEGMQLQGVIRGALDTVPKAHADQSVVWFYSPIRMDILPVDFAANNTVNVKLLPTTFEDAVTEGEATAMQVVFNSDADIYRSGKPFAPNELSVNASTRPASIDMDTDTGGSVLGMTVGWTRRSRGTTKIYQHALGQDDDGGTSWGNLAADGDGNVDLQYNIWVYDLDATPSPSNRSEAVLMKTSASGSTVSSQVVTRAELFDISAAGHIPSQVRIEIEAIDDLPNAETDNPSFEPLLFDASMTSEWQTTASVDLNGSDEYLANTSDSTLGISTVWSLECWVKPRSNAGGTEVGLLVLKPSASFNSAILLTLSDDSDTSPFRIRIYNSSGTLFKDYLFGSYTSGDWTQLAVTWNGSTLTVYQDGVVDASPTKTLDNAGSTSTNGRQVIIGVDETLAAGFLDGLPHRQAIWDIARSAASVAASYNSGDAPGFEPRITDDGDYDGDEDDLIHCWDWRDSTDIGRDFGHGTAIDVATNASNISAADLSADEPS